MTRGVWGEREERWLRERYAYEHAPQLVAEFEREFGKKVSKGALYTRANKLGLLKCLRGTNARQVIVDELADTQTTVLDLTETTRTVHGEEVRGWECRECGQSCEEMYGEYEYCPHCGRKVVEP